MSEDRITIRVTLETGDQSATTQDVTGASEGVTVKAEVDVPAGVIKGDVFTEVGGLAASMLNDAAEAALVERERSPFHRIIDDTAHRAARQALGLVGIGPSDAPTLRRVVDTFRAGEDMAAEVDVEVDCGE